MKQAPERRLMTRLSIAAEIWDEIKDHQAPADRWLGNYFHKNRKRMGSQDRRFFSEITYGLFRHKRYIQHVAQQLNKKPDNLQLVLLAAAIEKVLGREAFLQLAPHVLPPLSVPAEAFYNSLNGFALAPAGEDTEAMALRYSFPNWLAKRWEQEFEKERLRKLLATFQIRPDLIIRTNTLKTTREKLLKNLTSQGYELSTTKSAAQGIVFKKRIGIFALDEFQKGLFEVQDEGSQLVCEMMQVRPDELVWDVCAGAGGKSLYLAALMKNKGRIVATDIRKDKLQDLKKRAKRAGAFNIFPADLDRMDDLKIAKGGFDKILVDAPCSGSGTLRRNPDAKWKITPERFERHHKEQVEIIQAVWPRLKKGGKLFYVTCSIDTQENEKTMQAVYEAISDMRLMPVKNLGDAGPYGNRLWPSAENDGFFMAMAEKV